MASLLIGCDEPAKSYGANILHSTENEDQRWLVDVHCLDLRMFNTT